MAKLVWDATAQHLYETGTDRGVLYPTLTDGTYTTGVAWNGLTGVDESPDGGDANNIYADNIKYLSLRGTEEFKGSIKAYTYPDEFAECDGSKAIATGVYAAGQTRKAFGFSYRTLVGNDVAGTDYGYKIHLVYGATVSPSQKSYQTVNDSPEAIEFSWDFESTPVSGTNLPKPTSHLTIDSTKVPAAALTAIENALYGTSEAEPRLLLPDEVVAEVAKVATSANPANPAQE